MATKRVRVAVWIDSEGDYFASGGSRFSEKNTARMTRGTVTTRT